MIEFDPTEVVAVILGLFGYFFVIRALQRNPSTTWLFYAYTALILGGIITLIEEISFPDALNFAEHALYGIAGILFAYAALKTHKKIQTLQGGHA